MWELIWAVLQGAASEIGRIVLVWLREKLTGLASALPVQDEEASCSPAEEHLEMVRECLDAARRTEEMGYDE